MANALDNNQEDGGIFFIFHYIKASFGLKEVMVAEYISLKRN